MAWTQSFFARQGHHIETCFNVLAHILDVLICLKQTSWSDQSGGSANDVATNLGTKDQSACRCGSIINGHRRERSIMMAFLSRSDLLRSTDLCTNDHLLISSSCKLCNTGGSIAEIWNALDSWHLISMC